MDDVAEQLARLADLHERGVISAAEFAAAKAKALGPAAPNPAGGEGARPTADVVPNHESQTASSEGDPDELGSTGVEDDTGGDGPAKQRRGCASCLWSLIKLAVAVWVVIFIVGFIVAAVKGSHPVADLTCSTVRGFASNPKAAESNFGRLYQRTISDLHIRPGHTQLLNTGAKPVVLTGFYLKDLEGYELPLVCDRRAGSYKPLDSLERFIRRYGTNGVEAGVQLYEEEQRLRVKPHGLALAQADSDAAEAAAGLTDFLEQNALLSDDPQNCIASHTGDSGDAGFVGCVDGVEESVQRDLKRPAEEIVSSVTNDPLSHEPVCMRQGTALSSGVTNLYDEYLRTDSELVAGAASQSSGLGWGLGSSDGGLGADGAFSNEANNLAANTNAPSDLTSDEEAWTNCIFGEARALADVPTTASAVEFNSRNGTS